MNVQLTKRDRDLLDWINNLGFVNINHVSRRYKISPVTAYARLRKLAAAKYVQHQRVLHNEPGVYRVTRSAVNIAEDMLQPIRHISLGKYRHTKLLADLSVHLSETYQADFITERQLRHTLSINGVGHKGHLCDGVLKFNGKNIAIELELTTKGKRRLQSIIRSYRRSFDYQEVWYFCGSQSVRNLVGLMTEGDDFINVFLLNTFLE